MRLLFSSLSHYGHVFPMLPLAAAAARAGHQVGYAVGGALHPTLAALGLEPITAGMPLREAFEQAGRERFGAPVHFGELTPDQIEDHVAVTFGSVLPRGFAEDLGPVLAEFEPELVIYDAVCPGAGAAAVLAGVPAVCHGLGHHRLITLTEQYVREVRGFAAGLGLDFSAEDPNPLGHPYLDIYPPSLQDPHFLAKGDRVPLRPVPFAQPGELPSRLRLSDRERPLIYLTLGTEAGADGAGGVLRAAIDGLSTMDAQVLVAVGPKLAAEQFRDVPETVIVEPWVPQADLLPHLDLVVHHGGAGTTLGSLGNAVPQVVMPRGADQFVNAEAVLAAGAGERLMPDEVTARAVADAAGRVLAEPGFRRASRRVADEIATMPVPDEVVAALPGMAQ